MMLYLAKMKRWVGHRAFSDGQIWEKEASGLSTFVDLDLDNIENAYTENPWEGSDVAFAAICEEVAFKRKRCNSVMYRDTRTYI
jgi:hypothetical protein